MSKNKKCWSLRILTKKSSVLFIKFKHIRRIFTCWPKL